MIISEAGLQEIMPASDQPLVFVSETRKVISNIDPEVLIVQKNELHQQK